MDDGIKYDTPSGRRYRHPGDTHQYPSVTTIIGSVWPSHWLDHWKDKNAARAMLLDAKNVSKKLKRLADRPEDMLELYVPKYAEMMNKWRQDYTAANRGTRIHQGLEDSLNGTSDKKLKKTMVSEEFATMVAARTALLGSGFVPEYVEAPVYGRCLLYTSDAADE